MSFWLFACFHSFYFFPFISVPACCLLFAAVAAVEVHGVCGEAPGRVHVVESSDDAHLLPFSAEDKLFYVTQTTLSVMDCLHIETELKTRYPNIETIKSGSVCYATYNRQAALGALAAHAQLAIVVGSRSSSNALRLVEIAKSKGIPYGYLQIHILHACM